MSGTQKKEERLVVHHRVTDNHRRGATDSATMTRAQGLGHFVQEGAS
jgi:hypothetical protein